LKESEGVLVSNSGSLFVILMLTLARVEKTYSKAQARWFY